MSQDRSGRMVHAIWDQGTFRLWLPEARALCDELIKAISDPTHIREVADEALVTDVEVTGVPSTFWLNVLRRAAEVGRLRAVVERVRARSVPPSLTAALDAADAVQDVGGSLHPQRMILEGPKVFIARPKLREHLRRLQEFSSKHAILVVRGPTQTGRSETQSFLFDRNADVKAYVDQLVPLKETMRHVWKLAAGSTVEPPASHTTEAASFLAFWNDVHAALEDRDKRMWVLLDDLDKGVHRDDVTMLGETLAQRMTDATFQRRFRLVLLGYPKPVLATKLRPLEDVTKQLDADDVRDFVNYCCIVRGKNVGSTQIDVLARDLCATAEGLVDDVTSFSGALNETLVDWYERFFK